MTDQAFVTLTTNDAYAKGALVLGSSLKQHRTTRRLAVLVTPQVSDSMRKTLETIFDEVIMVDVLDSGDSAHLTLMKRPELGITLTKLHCWSLTQYSKCVFMDADTLVLANIDDLFEREELSAAPDPGWPDCFNSGVFVYQPSVETYNQLLHLASEQGSFDGGDQGLLNTFFGSWATADIRKHLPFIYNLSSVSIYSYLPAFKAKMSQEPYHSCPLGRSQLRHSLLYPQKNGRSGGNRARLITWEQIPLTTSRGSWTLTSSRNTALFRGHIHFTGTCFRYLVSRAGLRRVCYSC
ncbi:PREDICTED: glycogenin-1 isoform X3 [Lipotes vexillifer]|uniref:glycogenin glucosyltransferase n=1 Tax=Lipotes vexillifer TaxID=118797 RepID=A0A340YEJ3_LIPVE|nr:PREDICTED: glycogenin-1 isoform X3 [Lipotes vexillifer]